MTEQPDAGTRSPDPSPDRSPWHISRIPAHLGRARTSTVVLAVLFVAIFALYLYVKPDAPGTTTTGGATSQVPAATTARAPATKAPTSTATPTREQPTTTTTETATPTDVPTETSTPEPSTGSSAPSTTATTLPAPTVSPPTG
jgi:hypothetical protein